MAHNGLTFKKDPKFGVELKNMVSATDTGNNFLQNVQEPLPKQAKLSEASNSKSGEIEITESVEASNYFGDGHHLNNNTHGELENKSGQDLTNLPDRAASYTLPPPPIPEERYKFNAPYGSSDYKKYTVPNALVSSNKSAYNCLLEFLHCEFGQKYIVSRISFLKDRSGNSMPNGIVGCINNQYFRFDKSNTIRDRRDPNFEGGDCYNQPDFNHGGFDSSHGGYRGGRRNQKPRFSIAQAKWQLATTAFNIHGLERCKGIDGAMDVEGMGKAFNTMCMWDACETMHEFLSSGEIKYKFIYEQIGEG